VKEKQSMTQTTDALFDQLQTLIGREVGPLNSWDPVNLPMVRHWCEAMGIDNPVYLDADAARASVHGAPVAPPTMLQVWSLSGLGGRNPPGSATENPYVALQKIQEAGYPAIVAVNSEQEYISYLRHGDQLYRTSQIESISPRKETALGTGYFLTELMRFFNQRDELVGTMRFRLFIYRAPASASKQEPKADAPAAAAAQRPRPNISPDTQFFWDGLRQRQLLIQRCADCGRLRHPPGPACPACHSLRWDTVTASGRATLFSFVVSHHPQLPSLPQPNPIGLVALEEGTRLVAGLVRVDPAAIRIGMPLQLDFLQDDELVLPVFAPA
jgi:uncharacterized OB-fold protein